MLTLFLGIMCSGPISSVLVTHILTCPGSSLFLLGDKQETKFGGVDRCELCMCSNKISLCFYNSIA